MYIVSTSKLGHYIGHFKATSYIVKWIKCCSAEQCCIIIIIIIIIIIGNNNNNNNIIFVMPLVIKIPRAKN